MERMLGVRVLLYCTVSKIKNLYPRILKEGRLHSNTVKEAFPLQKGWAKKETAEEKLGKKTKKWVGVVVVEKSQRSIINVNVIIQQASILELQWGAEFISFWLPPSLPLSPIPPLPLSPVHSLPDYAPCGCDDKDVRAAVRECARTLLTVPHPRLNPTPHTFFACNKSTVHPENQPGRLSLALPSSLSFYHTQPHRSRLCLEGRNELGWFFSPLSIWLTHPSGAISSVC